MISLRLDKEAPDGSCVLAHYSVSPLSPRQHLSLWDRSFYDEANRTGRELLPLAVEVGAPVGDTELTVFNDSLLDREVRLPVPLPYVWNIGTNTALGRNRLYVYDEAANSLGTFNPAATSGSDFLTRRNAESIIRKNLEIIDQRGDQVTGLLYDVEIIGRSTSSNGYTQFDVNLKLPVEDTRFSFYRLKYNAVDSSVNRVITGYTEAINLEPDVPIEVRDSQDATPGGYVLATETQRTDSSITLEEYNATSPTYLNLLGLFATSTGVQVRIVSGSPNTLEIDYPNAPSAEMFTLPSTKTIESLVAEINNAGLPIMASLLAYGAASDVLDTFSYRTVPESGIGLRADNHYGVMHSSRSKINASVPRSSVDIDSQWYLRINTGQFRKRTNNADILYSVPEYEDQTFSPNYSTGYFDVYDEFLIRVAPNILQTSNPNIAIESVQLYVNGRYDNSYIEDYDESAGVIYTSGLPLDSEVRACYSYQEENYIYTGLNLNPTSIHNPDAPTSVYVVYIIPSTIERFAAAFSSNPTYQTAETTDTAVRYAVGSTVEQALAGMEQDSTDQYGRDLYPVALAIVHVTNNLDIKDAQFVDCRTLGGGIPKAHVDQPESEYYAGIGYVGGEPFPSTGPVVIEVPKSIIGTKENSVNPTLDEAEGYTSSGGESEDSIRRRYGKFGPAGTKPFIRKLDE